MNSKVLTSLFLSLILLVLTFFNNATITVNFIFFNTSMSLSLFMIFMIAVLSVIFLSVMDNREDNFKKILKNKNRQISNLKKTNSMINNSAFGKSVQEEDNQTDEFKADAQEPSTDDIYDILISDLSHNIVVSENDINESPKKQAKKKDIGKPYDSFKGEELNTKSIGDIIANKLNTGEYNTSSKKTTPKYPNVRTSDDVASDLQNDNKTDTSRISKEDTKKIQDVFKGFQDLKQEEFLIKNSTPKKYDEKLYEKAISSKKVSSQAQDKYDIPIIDLKSEFNAFLESTLTFSKKEIMKSSAIDTSDDYIAEQVDETVATLDAPTNDETTNQIVLQSKDETDIPTNITPASSTKDIGSSNTSSKIYDFDSSYSASSQDFALTIDANNIASENILSVNSVRDKFNKPYDISLYANKEKELLENINLSDIKKALINEIFSGNRAMRK